MAFIIGAVLALAVALFAVLTGLERDKAFYTTVAIVVASYYALFAVMAGSLSVLALESVAIAAFVTVAIIGYKKSFWLVAAALAGHGLFDAVHGFIITNPGVPLWWPAFCAGFDVVAGAYIGWWLWRKSTQEE